MMRSMHDHQRPRERALLAADLYRVAHLTGEFQLRSGQTATEYFDKYQFEARPELLSRVAQALVPLVPARTEVLAGLELGGVPVATALSLLTGLPVAFVRKRAKTYGTCRVSEGVEIAGGHVLVIEDVVSSGGQVVTSTQDLRALGATVTAALCVIDREAGGAAALDDIGVELKALYVADDLLPVGRRSSA
jgi:orotate phosphoribosyltransferase